MTADPASEGVPRPPGAQLPPDQSGRAAYVISQLYYYVAAVVGVGFIIGGLVAFLFGVRTLVLPLEHEGSREGLRTMLIGLSFALPALAMMLWHLRQARRREGHVRPGTFWGSALYFHLVALIALFFVFGGTVGILASAASGAVPHCFEPPLTHGMLGSGGSECYPGPEEAARNVIDASIFVIVAAPIMWWHLRQGRRLTSPDAV